MVKLITKRTREVYVSSYLENSQFTAREELIQFTFNISHTSSHIYIKSKNILNSIHARERARQFQLYDTTKWLHFIYFQSIKIFPLIAFLLPSLRHRNIADVTKKRDMHTDRQVHKVV